MLIRMIRYRSLFSVVTLLLTQINYYSISKLINYSTVEYVKHFQRSFVTGVFNSMIKLLL